MHSVFLSDSFSTNEVGLFGRAIANRRLLKALLLCDEIGRVYTTSPATLFSSLMLPGIAQAKLVQLTSLAEVDRVFADNQIQAVFCSDFISHYPNWIHYRNIHGLNTAVFGFTHSLSYQRYTADIYHILCARPAPNDGILCTSRCAEDVLERLFARVAATLNRATRSPRLIRFPLPFEPDSASSQTEKPKTDFQVLFVGRLDWQTKADLLVLKSVIPKIPKDLNIHFVVAGPADNEPYLQLVRQELGPLGVKIVVSASEEEKRRLYLESHVLFSPSDNYQETFGLTVIEAMHFGCVPVVTDFDGYRDLVRDGVDGFRLKTVAARIPAGLFSAQSVVSEATYHGWWAAGVAFDPREAARLIVLLAQDEMLCARMRSAAREAVFEYSLARSSSRFGSLVTQQSRLSDEALVEPQVAPNQNPFEWSYLELFATHPTEIWSNQSMALTEEGANYLVAPFHLPQFMLLSQSIGVGDIRKLLFLIQRGHAVLDCLQRGVEPIVMSLALKNGLVTITSCGSPPAP